MITIDKIKQLREETGLSIGECQKALKEANGDLAKAKEILRKRGQDFAKKRIEKEVGHGIIESYIHPGKKIGTMLELRCESDFVAKSEDFQKLAHELCLQIAAISPEEVDELHSSSRRGDGRRNLFLRPSPPFANARVTELLEQPWIKDESKNIKELIEEHIAKFGENIILKRFVRYEL